MNAVERYVAELIRIKELNVELLDVLTEAAQWFVRFHEETRVAIPNLNAITYLIGKAHTLLKEIDSPPNLQHRFRTPDDATEPYSVYFIIWSIMNYSTEFLLSDLYKTFYPYHIIRLKTHLSYSP